MNVIQEVAAKNGWGDESILERPAPPPQQPTCHCPPPAKNRLGGQQPAIDRDAGVIRCRTCLKPIPDACKRRSVQHLRSLLQAPEHQVDWSSVPDLLLRG